MSEITNTSKQDPMVHLMGSLGEGTSGYIEGMEARGQQELVNSTRLPADARGLNTGYGQDGWPDFEALGFRKGEPVEGDDLFVNAELPEGWSRKRSDHAMWSYLHDERDIRRVAVFYKAAFYDRGAHMHILQPGSEVASEVIYGEGDVTLPDYWSLLTAEERQQAVDYIADYRQNIERCPDIYGERKGRVDTFAALINA
ncbi:hypothetical protein ACFV6Y_38780 [Streptomyces massasporeus]|uniref:hypothetical protein n=1 Tax=Streptomyces massasporeus TaxID=67324 RepID=UPI003648487E